MEMKDRLREIRFKNLKTQKEVADSMNISQSYISRLEKKILHKLKNEMSRNIEF